MTCKVCRCAILLASLEVIWHVASAGMMRFDSPRKKRVSTLTTDGGTIHETNSTSVEEKSSNEADSNKIVSHVLTSTGEAIPFSNVLIETELQVKEAETQVNCAQCYQPNGQSQCVAISDATICNGCAPNPNSHHCPTHLPQCLGNICQAGGGGGGNGGGSGGGAACNRNDGVWFVPLGSRTVAATGADCKQRCVSEGMPYYNKFPNGGCHCADESATEQYDAGNPTEVSGPVTCGEECAGLTDRSDYNSDCMAMITTGLANDDPRNYCLFTQYRGCTTGAAPNANSGWIGRFVSTAFLNEINSGGYWHVRVNGPDYSRGPSTVFSGRLVSPAKVIVTCGCVGWDHSTWRASTVTGLPSGMSWGTFADNNGRVSAGAAMAEFSQNVCGYEATLPAGDYTGSNAIRCMAINNRKFSFGTWIKPA